MKLNSECDTTVVILTGGLGNQLFQFAAGIHFSRALGTKLILDQNLGSPRRSSTGTTEICEYDLPNYKGNIFSKEYLPFTKRLYGAVLVTNLSSGGYRRSIRLPINFLGNFVFKRELGRAFSIHVAKNIGYSITHIRENEILIGYFQSYKYLEATSLSIMRRELVLSGDSHKVFESWKVAAEIEKPIIIHVRRGDYKNEKFGLLGVDYYKRALKNFVIGKSQKIWIFSDEMDKAQVLFSEFSPSIIKFIDTSSYSSALTLKIMSLGDGYILANSSFGYWAAQLSGISSERVISPSPWFKEIVEPQDLINPDWRRTSATWE